MDLEEMQVKLEGEVSENRKETLREQARLRKQREREKEDKVPKKNKLCSLLVPGMGVWVLID